MEKRILREYQSEEISSLELALGPWSSPLVCDVILHQGLLGTKFCVLLETPEHYWLASGTGAHLSLFLTQTSEFLTLHLFIRDTEVKRQPAGICSLLLPCRS